MTNRPLSPADRARIAADYGLDPGMVTTLVRVCPPGHASADTAPPVTPGEVIAIYHRNRARMGRLASAKVKPAPQPLPTWGDE